MINRLVSVTECEVCSGALELDEIATINDYAIMMVVDSSNVFDSIEDIIEKYLVYKCSHCGQVFKYTYRDLEKLFRIKLTEQALMLLAKGQIDVSSCLQDKHLIYCGKCTGLDGQGSCTKSIFEKCEIKRFPLNEL